MMIDDDDLQWVQARTVPMHLGLIDRPFVPHNLISAQYSPVPLLNFQMALRLKILMSSVSRKGTQIYYPFPFKKSRQRNPLKVPQKTVGHCRHMLGSTSYCNTTASFHILFNSFFNDPAMW
jgi:hypothetical protein